MEEKSAAADVLYLYSTAINGESNCERVQRQHAQLGQTRCLLHRKHGWVGRKRGLEGLIQVGQLSWGKEMPIHGYKDMVWVEWQERDLFSSGELFYLGWYSWRDELTQLQRLEAADILKVERDFGIVGIVKSGEGLWNKSGEGLCIPPAQTELTGWWDTKERTPNLSRRSKGADEEQCMAMLWWP